ncbi:MAG: S9 family peptidase [Planctomycetota bacterium]
MSPTSVFRFAVLFLALLAGHGVAQSPERRLSPHDVLDFRTVGTAQLSPDGRSIAYVLVVPRAEGDPDGPARSQLRLVGSDGADDRLLSDHPGGVSSLRWSATGDALHFLSRRSGDAGSALYALPLAGGEARRLVGANASITAYDVSPDGRRAVYTSARPVAAERRQEMAAGFDRVVFEEEEPPVELHLRDLESGEDRVLPLPGAPWDPAFSPDGGLIACWISPTARIDDRYMHRRLHVVDAVTGGVRQVADTQGKVGNFVFSPNGKRIALVAAADLHDPKESGLLVVDIASGSKIALTPADFPGHVSEVSWQGDDRVVFLTAEGTATTLSRQPTEEGAAIEVLLRRDDLVLGHYSAGPEGAFALVADTPFHPPELYHLAPGPMAEPRRLTRSNPILEEVRLAPQRVVRYQTKDKIEIEGVLIEPLDRREGERVPLIVVVHGGPESHYSNGWLTRYSMPGQVAAARGFAVFHPNYRSSTGRGVAFSKLGQGRSGREEFDDIVEGVDHLVKAGLADRKRVGITGGSYGGYASAWGATYYSDRFAASVMFVGISDQISKVFTTDIPDESFLVHWRMRPWDDNWQKFLEASPIYWIKRANTPILIAHGAEDPRVSPTQSTELYRALKLKGDVPVRMVRYPGEGHGNRRRASQLD